MTGLIRTAYATHAQPAAAIGLCRERLGLEAPDLILAFVGGKGVEIAPFAGQYSRPLDGTGVLTILQHEA